MNRKIWGILAMLVLVITACSNGGPATTHPEAPLPPLATASETSEATTGNAGTPGATTDLPGAQSRPSTETQGQSPTPTPVIRLNLDSNPPAVSPAPDQIVERGSDPPDSDAPDDEYKPKAEAEVEGGQKEDTVPTVDQPQQPQFTDQILLQDIYPGINLERYALNKQDPALKEQPARHPQVPFEEYRDHPYIHMFPALQMQIREISREAERLGENPPREFSHQLYEKAFNHDDKSEFRPRYGVEHFLAHPYWEPLLETSIQTRKTQEISDWLRTPYGDFNARHFGKTSTRQIIADAVETMLDEAMLPTVKPYKLPWLDEPARHTNPPPLGEYIKTAIAPNHSSPSHDVIGIPFPAYMPPKSNWDFVDPKLPIIKVAATTETTLPLSAEEADTEQWPFAPRVNESIPQISKYTVHFVIAFQNRWRSFSDHNRWVLRFTESMRPEGTETWWEGTTECRADHCKWDMGHGALDDELANKFPLYWHPSDYMQHSIIGEIILVVHESPVLKEGVYAVKPGITHWEAPGPIVKTEQLNAPWFPEFSTVREFPILQRWPYPGRPNPGYPLPGHVYADAASAPGSRVWEEWGLSPDWE